MEADCNDPVDEMNLTFIKRRYYDLRLGGTMISPVIQMANFSMISFLYVREYLPIELFGPLFMISGFILLAYIGVKFRRHQASTDYDMLFAKQTQQAKIFYSIMKAIKERETDENFDKQMSYLKEIIEGKA